MKSGMRGNASRIAGELHTVRAKLWMTETGTRRSASAVFVRARSCGVLGWVVGTRDGAV